MGSAVLSSIMNFKNDLHRKAVFANMNRFSGDAFKKISSDIQNRVHDSSSGLNDTNVSVFYTNVPILERFNNSMNFADSDILGRGNEMVNYSPMEVDIIEDSLQNQLPGGVDINFIPIEKTDDIRVELPEEMGHNIKEEYGEHMVLVREREVADLMARGATKENALKLINGISGRYNGDLVSLVGKKFNNDKVDNYIKKATSFHEGLEKLQDDARIKNRKVGHVKAPVGDGTKRLKKDAIAILIVKHYGQDALDSFDFNAVDWSESTNELKKHIIENLHYYETRSGPELSLKPGCV